MPTCRLSAPHIDFGPLRRELALPADYPATAAAQADAIAAQPPPLPRADLTDVAFVTIDPPGSMDLDQAMCLQRRPGGYRILYAISDVAAFIPSDGPLLTETWRRGQTIYLPDGKVPLHPLSLSEGAASLLADQVRPAVVWTLDLDSSGGFVDVQVQRAAVRSRAKLAYPAVQADADAGRLAEPIALLPEIGQLLIERALDRGAINLPLPAQEVFPTPDGGWRLALIAQLPVEQYNAQISLATGMAAGQIMVGGAVGLLRTMPPPPLWAIDRLRTAAASLAIDWPSGASPGRVVASVNPGDPRGAAFLNHAAELMRGAGYTAFDGTPPDQPQQAAVAAPYAHVTAPLRRLADRYATEVCVALVAGTPVPGWARDALPRLVPVMAGSDHLAGTADRAAVDLTEAVVLEHRIGELFDAAVLDIEAPNHHPHLGVAAEVSTAATSGGAMVTQAAAVATAMPAHPSSPQRAVVAIDEPAVRSRCDGTSFVLGSRIPVRLVVADPGQRRVLFEAVVAEAGAAHPDGTAGP